MRAPHQLQGLGPAGGEQDDPHLILQPLPGRQQCLVPAQQAELFMKGEVDVERLDEGLPRLVRGQRLTQLLRVVGVLRRGDDLAHGQRLQCCADSVHLPDLALVRGVHVLSAAGPTRDQASVLQRPQGLPDRAAADVEALREVHLRQRRPRPELTGDDGVAQILQDLLAEREAVDPPGGRRHGVRLSNGRLRPDAARRLAECSRRTVAACVRGVSARRAPWRPAASRRRFAPPPLGWPWATSRG